MSVFIDVPKKGSAANPATLYSAQAREVTVFLVKLLEGEERELLEFLNSCKALVKSGNYGSLLVKLLPSFGTALEKSEEKDVEVCLNLFCSLMRRVKDAEVRRAVYSGLLDALASGDVRVDFRIQMLVNLFNVISENDRERLNVFSALVSYVAKHQAVAPQLVAQLSKVSTWLKQWRASAEQQRAIYLSLRDLMIAAEETVHAHSYGIAYLRSFEDSEVDDISPEAIEIAAQITIEAIRQTSGTVVCDAGLLELRAVKALESKRPLIHRLFSVFTSDDLEAFRALHSEHPELLESVELDFSKCEKEMRLISLSELAQGKDSITFDQVAEGLGIPKEDVELWVIEAVAHAVIEAKIDEPNANIIITRAPVRKFGDREWKQLGAQISAWRSKVSEMLGTIEDHKARAQRLLAESDLVGEAGSRQQESASRHQEGGASRQEEVESVAS